MKRLFIIRRLLILYLFLIIALGSSNLFAQQTAPFLAIGDDVDATAFLQQTAITDATQQLAIKNLVRDLKLYGLWTKMQAIYPMVGGTATTHKWNLKDPRDLDAAFRLSFVGGWTHSATGVKGNGTTGYANTFYNVNTQASLTSANLSVYSRTDVAVSTYDIAADGSCRLLTRYTGDLMYSSWGGGQPPALLHQTL